jgi:hypothetical protein
MGHGNEADFLESLTLPFEPFRFSLRIRGEIRSRKMTRRVGESTRLPIDTIFFKPLNKSIVIVHNIPGLFFAKLVLLGLVIRLKFGKSMINLKKISNRTPRLTIANPRLAESESRFSIKNISANSKPNSERHER